MPHVRYSAAGALALASIILLVGCSAPQGAFTDLQGKRDIRDELPQLGDGAYDNVDVETSRLVGEHEGTLLWLAEGLDDSAVCLVADAGDDWIVGCGRAAVKVGGAAGSFEVVPDGAIAPESATQVSENVYGW